MTSFPGSKCTSTPVSTGRDSSREAERLTRATVSSNVWRSTSCSSIPSVSGSRGKSSALYVCSR